MSKYHAVHKAEVSPLEEVGVMLHASEPGSHRTQDIVVPSETYGSGPQRLSRMREFGAVVMDRLTPTWDRSETAAVLGVVVGYAAFASSAVYVHHHPLKEPEKIARPPHYYVHLKTSSHGDSLESLIDRYGRTHNLPWTMNHSYNIADTIVTESGATEKADGESQVLITSPYDNLEPGVKVRIVRYMLEKPTPLNDSTQTSSAP